ncbi:MAG: fatty acid cis/trans isomerase [Moraxellaceae bacterium]|nr:fatty acid cis/trans isomerase [Moraxellaceae bacterium]
MSFCSHFVLTRLLPTPLLLVFLFLAPGFLQAQTTPVMAPDAPALVSWSQHIQPLFNQKCVVCHACYDAACQLNLGSAAGLQRGGSKKKVYDGTRTEAATPTRLFMDAQDISGWRQKGFHPVIPEGSPAPSTGATGTGTTAAEATGAPATAAGPATSLLAGMLALGRRHTLIPNARLPDDLTIGINRDNQCPTADELPAYEKKHPNGGMPLGVTGLSDAEYQLITRWLAEGAVIDERLRQPSAKEAAEIRTWEAFLNQDGLREQLLARWLYEHLFLAHLYFENVKNSQFFELVRSRTPPGEPMLLVPTAQPNDDPQGRVYYRLRPVQGAIVHKTHITFGIGPKRLARIQSLFFSTPWQVDSLPGYSANERANPFVTFSALPARARYQFMLDSGEYFTRTFIRGPVCRGQIATDVIRDHFWTLFQSPDHDLYVLDADYRRRVDPLLAMPGQNDSLLALGPEWIKHRSRRNEYLKFREATYAEKFPAGPGLHDIWQGDGHNRNALLTINRHFDNASVRQGWYGELPQTVWWQDYPLFERTYYELVVNFNVFGNVAHQAQTRMYFDLIRHGAETNFLRLLPPASRQAYMDDWYQGSGKLKQLITYPEIDTEHVTAITYRSQRPKDELLQTLLQRMAPLNARPDPINRCVQNRCARKNVPRYQAVADQALSRLASLPASVLPVTGFLPEVSFIRVYQPDQQREIYTLIRNRAHSNVAFMYGEDWRYQPGNDTLTVYPGILASYPNFAFNVAAADINAFVDALAAVRTANDMDGVIARWGIRRSHPAFWFYFQDYTRYLEQTEPLEAGILDLNRYENL